MKTLAALLGLALLAFALGCNREKPAVKATATASPAPAPAAAAAAKTKKPDMGPTRQLMAQHFRKAWDARDAIIRADFEAAKADARFLADPTHVTAIPPNLQPKLPPMQAAARELIATDSLTEAGIAFARMLHRCGECHAAAAPAGPRFDPPPPPEGTGLDTEMKRHRWAADRMWEGMVGHDPHAFTRAAEVLANTQMGVDAIAERTHADPQKLGSLVHYVHEMADQARNATSADARIDAYGRFLASCAACHRLVGKGPGHDSQPSLQNQLVPPPAGAHGH